MSASAKSKTVAVLGYGSQGRAIALNLRDSGYDIVVGLPVGSKSGGKVKADKIGPPLSIRKATSKASTIVFSFPDHLHAPVFQGEISDFLVPGSTLVFLHGSSIHFELVLPPVECDVILIAPHAPGSAVREKFLTTRDISAFYAIHQDWSGKAEAKTFALARGMGFSRKRLMKSTFRQEAIGDLFGEQAVLCGGLSMLVRNGFDTLISNGWKPEHAYLEVAYQLDLIVELIKKNGLAGMLKKISVAARYGSVKNGPRVIGKSVKKEMEKVYREIASGEFVRKLAGLSAKELADLEKQTMKLSRPAFEKAARKMIK